MKITDLYFLVAIALLYAGAYVLFEMEPGWATLPTAVVAIGGAGTLVGLGCAGRVS